LLRETGDAPQKRLASERRTTPWLSVFPSFHFKIHPIIRLPWKAALFSVSLKCFDVVRRERCGINGFVYVFIVADVYVDI
jgi:hypothetical protein